MAITFSEVVGLGVPATIVAIDSNRLLAMWWGLGAWMWSESDDEGQSWSTPSILTQLYPADASDRSETLFLRAIAAHPDGDDVFFAFRQQDVTVDKEDGASPLVRIGKAAFSGGNWTFTFGGTITIGESNKRADNHFILPEIRSDGTLIHVLTCRPDGAISSGNQRWRLEAFNKSLVSQYSSTQDEATTTPGRLTSLALGDRATKIGVAMSFANGDVKAYPAIVAAGGSYTTFPGTGTVLSGGGALDNTERPIVSLSFEGDADDVRVYAIDAATLNTWRFDSTGPTWGSASGVTTSATGETVDSERSAGDVIFAQMSQFEEPELRVDADALITDDKVEMPPGAILPFRTIVRTSGTPVTGTFKNSNLIAISDLVAGRLYFVDWRAVPLKPIDLDPDSGEHVGDGLVTLKARYRMQEELTGKLVFEIDNDINFGSINQTHEATLLSDGQMGTVTTTALAEGTWYWRVKGNVSGRGDGVYSETRSFVVGATTSDCTPEDGLAIESTGDPPGTDVEFCCTINVVSGVTAHMDVEVDRVETFDSVHKKTGSGPNVLDGLESCVTIQDLGDGVWFWRARAETATGTIGPWGRPQGLRIGTSGEARAGDEAPFRHIISEPAVSERGQDVVNRVYVKVRGTAIEVVRETDPAPAANRRREHVIWLESGDEAICSQVAADYLDAHSSTQRSVDQVVVPLTPGLRLDRKVRLVLPDGSAGTWAPQRVEHDLAAFTTTITAGDWQPTIEQALARLADRLERSRSEDRAR